MSNEVKLTPVDLQLYQVFTNSLDRLCAVYQIDDCLRIISTGGYIYNLSRGDWYSYRHSSISFKDFVEKRLIRRTTGVRSDYYDAFDKSVEEFYSSIKSLDTLYPSVSSDCSIAVASTESIVETEKRVILFYY